MRKNKAEEIINQVQASYNAIAESFDLTRKKEIWPQMLKYSDRVKDGDRVLDLGCGNGRLLKALEGKNIEYLGLDGSKNLIEIAKNNFPGHNFKELNVLNLETGLDKENKFEHIFLLAVLQHIPSKEIRLKVLKDLNKRLSQEGELVMSNWNLWRQKKKRKKIFKFALLKLVGKNSLDFKDITFNWKGNKDKQPVFRYYHAFSANELRNLAKKAGFRYIEIEKDQYNYWLRARK